MALHPDWLALLSLLRSENARFLIVGAHALAVHGVPRFTGDLDILVERSPENAAAVMAALTKFGFGNVGLHETDFTRPNRVAQLGFPPVRIDLLTSISGVSFSKAWSRRVETTLGGEPVAVLGLEDMIRNKKAAGRPKDLADIAALTALQDARAAAASKPAGRSDETKRPRRQRRARGGSKKRSG